MSSIVHGFATVFSFLISGKSLNEAFGCKDDYVYLLALVLCFVLSYLSRLIKHPSLKQLYFGSIGMLLAYLMAGSQFLHSFLTVIGGFILHQLFHNSKYLSPLTFIWTFGYLTFFRASIYIGLPPFSSLANAVQLLLTLRLSSLAFDTQLYNLPSSNPTFTPFYSSFLNYAESSVVTRLFQYIGYSYCFLGILTGPFFRPRTYWDMIHQCYNPIQGIPVWTHALKSLQCLPLFISVHLLLTWLWPFSFVGTDEYYNHPWGVAFRIAYFVPYCVAFRWRFYIAWCVSVSTCILSGLGAYPESGRPMPGTGPTAIPTPGDENFNFATVQNIRVWEIEISTAIEQPVTHWNMTVQSFFYIYIYRSFSNKSMGRVATYLLSAYWHGIHPGYYIAFIMFVWFIFAQKCFVKITQPLRTSSTANIWLAIDFFVTWRFYEYSGFAFLMLDLNEIMIAWRSVYYYGHIISLCFVTCSILQSLFRSRIFPRKKNL